MDIEFLAKLVEIDTSNIANYDKCMEIMLQKAKSSGLPAELHYSKKEKPNLIVSLDANAAQTLLLAAHYDVVPAGEGWKHAPYKLFSEGNRAYGRGAADDKGGVISAFSAIEELKKKGSSKVNVKLLVTCDEEVGGEDGLGFLMEKKTNGSFILAGDAAILIDSGPKVYIGSSGRIGGRIEAGGTLSELLGLLSKVIDYSKQREKIISKLASSSGKRIPGRFSVTMLDLSAGAVEYAEAGVKSNIIPGECRIKIRGKEEILVLGKQGHAGYPHRYENAIEKSLPLLKKAPEISDGEGKCQFVFDLRTTPEEDLGPALAEFEKYVKGLSAEARIEITEKHQGCILEEKHPFVGMLKNALGDKKAYGELGATDAKFFSKRGIPSICFGPISDDSNIHGKDEFVEIRDLETVSGTIVRLCENWKDL